MMQKMEDRARELDERIFSANERKEQMEEANRVRIKEFSKRWDIFKA